MTYVENFEDIFQNLLTLEKYRNSYNPDENSFWQKLFKNGICFVACNYNDNLIFGPSKFIGYKNNTIDSHIINRTSRDGRVTNPIIEEILKNKFQTDVKYETLFSEFCSLNNIAVRKSGSFGKPRKYIYY